MNNSPKSANKKKLAPEISDEEEAGIQAGIAQDPDNPEWTEEDFKRARPAREVVPGIVKAYEKGELRVRGGQKKPTKVQLTLRLDQDVVDHFKSHGKGWQSRLNSALRKAANL